VQHKTSEKLLNNIDFNNFTVCGDTRFDRVISIAENLEHVPVIKEFCNNAKVIVAGSTWEDDEATFVHYVNANTHIKFIIAPHEVDKENVNSLKKKFSGSILYSEWKNFNQQTIGNKVEEHQTKNTKLPTANCLIIDSIGILSRLYEYADITYVGGGFGYDGLHNILEAAVYGKPVIFGPQLDKNFEARELIECGGGIAIANALELEQAFTHLLHHEDELKKRGFAAKKYVYEKAGATTKIMEYIQENRLLIS
jgi:3-deoxy-D-manno-octulosonic-acid transferase